MMKINTAGDGPHLILPANDRYLKKSSIWQKRPFHRIHRKSSLLLIQRYHQANKPTVMGYQIRAGMFVLFLPVLLTASVPPCYKKSMTDHSRAALTSLVNIPVLCYHNIDTAQDKEDIYHISAAHFEQQVKALHDSGYHAILPDELYDHFKKGLSLPEKAVMFTFDDTHSTHFTVAAPVLEKYGFRGTFFIMTVCIGKKHYLTAQQISVLSRRGHTIGCHSYDHLPVASLTGEQWNEQLDKPLKKLTIITGTAVWYYAYPFGTWNDQAITALKKRGLKAAFQLSNGESTSEPMFTIRRMLVSGNWTAPMLLKKIRTSPGRP